MIVCVSFSLIILIKHYTLSATISTSMLLLFWHAQLSSYLIIVLFLGNRLLNIGSILSYTLKITEII
jgi:hypothetical protein